MHISRGLPLISAEHEPHLPGLAVPAAREVGRLLGLDLVHGVEHDHALADLGRVVVLNSPALAVAAPDAKRRLRSWSDRLVSLPRDSPVQTSVRPAVGQIGHVALLIAHFISSITCFSSAGIGGIGTRSTCIRRPPRARHDVELAELGALSGKSSRKCPPRLSLRSIAARA